MRRRTSGVRGKKGGRICCFSLRKGKRRRRSRSYIGGGEGKVVLIGRRRFGFIGGVGGEVG